MCETTQILQELKVLSVYACNTEYKLNPLSIKHKTRAQKHAREPLRIHVLTEYYVYVRYNNTTATAANCSDNKTYAHKLRA